jgi:hypothetical protein
MTSERALAICIVALLPAGCSSAAEEDAPAGGDFVATATVPDVVTTIGERPSSSRVHVAWTPVEGVDHFELEAMGAPGDRVRATAEATATTAMLTTLRSSTSYRIAVRACLDSACSRALSAPETTAMTAAEIWQVLGTGDGFGAATHIVPDGNTKGSLLRWGSDAPPDLAGRVQLYYDPMVLQEKGIKLATLPAAPTRDPASLTAFQPLAGYGMLRSHNPSAGEDRGPATFQAVALSPSMGGGVRIFFEGVIEGTTIASVYWVDSVDGYVGRDFHSGTPTQCQAAEIVPGGPCGTTLAVGVAKDGNAGVAQARQAKLVQPTLSDWRWDGAVGTPMIVTLHLESDLASCSQTFFNAGYAVYDGKSWKLEYSGDCPKLWPGVQAPMPIDVGNGRHKLYFSAHPLTPGPPGMGMGDNKPLRVTYADAAATGDASRLEFEDWEGSEEARDITIVWPSGAELGVAEKSMFDDFGIAYPTGEADYLVMVSNMSCPAAAPCGAPFVGAAVWLNP